MKRISFLITIMSVTLLSTISCSKEEVEDFLPVSKSIVAGECSAFAFSANLSCTFKDVDKIELALGKHGVLYCVKSDDVESVFKAWLDGSDNPGCTVFDKATVVTGEMKCTIEGLSPDTEYNYCLFLQKRDGTRQISAVYSFKTQPFNPGMEEVELEGIQSFVAFASAYIEMNNTDAGYCSVGFVVSNQSNCNVENSTVFSYGDKYEPHLGNYRFLYTIRLNGLESNKDYYCRSYVKYPVSSGQYAYIYGPEKTFKTKDFNKVAVDLGLPSGALWAAYNVGAEKPEEYGSYFAWGEIAPKSSYTWDNYQWKNSNKYNSDTTSVNVTSYKFIQLEDDAANYNWGGSWRIPSTEDTNELNEYCYSYNDTINGVKGTTFVSEINGNTFFIPYSGYMHDKKVIGAGGMADHFLRDMWMGDGAYWYWHWKQEAEWSSWDDFNEKYNIGRNDGLTIRPVYHKEQ